MPVGYDVAVTDQHMSSVDDSQFARLVVERRLCSANEVELIQSELKSLKEGGEEIALPELLIRHGYITHSQVTRLSQSLDDDSMYKPAQQIPGFQILGKLGQGAMAVVFKAKQLSLDRMVAIKILPKRLSENAEFVDRFYKEGKAAARLNHPNIVQAYDVGESNGYHYFVMEYIDGDTIYDRIDNGRSLAEPEALQIILQCTKALQHAHAQGLIHRDVKPKNIMLTKRGDVKLADMGLAREVGDAATAAAEAGRAYGTPYYISPEQIRGEIEIDGRADIYALGATFYHMVTGRVPFDGSSPSSVMHKHLKQPLTPPDHINHTLSSGVGEIIEVMMQKAPVDRYQSTEELIADLEAVVGGEPPLLARDRYDHHLLESLATPAPQDGASAANQPTEPRGGFPLQLAVALGVMLALSILCNVILLVTR